MVTVVMVRNDAGEDGTTWRQGISYSATPSFAKGLIGRGAAYADDGSLLDVALTATEITAVQSLVSAAGKTRPTLLIVGNSIAGQSCRGGASLLAGATATVAAATRAGNNVVTLAAGGVAALGLKAGGYIVIGLASQQPWPVRVLGINGQALTLSRRLPFAVRAGAGVATVTSPVLFGGTWRQTFGIHNYANALAGGVFDLLPGYGHGSATAAEILAVLPLLLAYYRPNAVMLSLFENDVPGSLTAQQMIDKGDLAAGMCRAVNATPIVLHSLPSFSSGGPRADEYDDLRAGVLSIGNRMPGAIGKDPGSIYLDTSIGATPRCPLPGWTDASIHPNESKRATIALDGGLVETLQSLTQGMTVDWSSVLFGVNASLAGVGGTAGAGTTGDVAANTTISCAGTGLSCVASKNADDSQRIVGADAGPGITAGSEVISVAQTYTLPTTWGPKTRVKLVVIVTIHSQTNLGALRLSGAFGGQSIDMRTSASSSEAFDPALIGRMVVLETMPVPVCDPSVTTGTLSLDYRTLTDPLGSFAVVSTAHYLGYALSQYGEYDDGEFGVEEFSTVTTVGSLPTAAAGLAGQRAIVTDANATTFLSTVAAGGSNVVPVFCTGAAWVIG